MIRQHANGTYYCDGRECGYPLAWNEPDPIDCVPGAWTCLDCGASMYAAREPMPQVIGFEAWASSKGLTTTADVDAHIHAGLRSAPTTKTYLRWNARQLADLQDKRSQARVLYDAEVAAGRVRPPSNTERLQANAQGHPDNPSTTAAQRVLAKRAARAQQKGED